MKFVALILGLLAAPLFAIARELSVEEGLESPAALLSSVGFDSLHLGLAFVATSFFAVAVALRMKFSAKRAAKARN